MSLIRRQSRRAIRIRKAADLIGCSPESIRTGAVGNFTRFQLNPDKRTSPTMIYESELLDYLERRDRKIKALAGTDKG